MKPNKINIVFVAMLLTGILCAMGSAAVAQSSGDEIHKDESGVKRMMIVHPARDAVIGDLQPMVTVDFSRLDVPVDISTVVVTFNGFNVTSETEINPVYAVYKPAVKLAPGQYDVRVTAANANHAELEPLSWRFTISEQKIKERLAAQPPRDRTVGRLVTSTGYVAARYEPRSLVDVSTLFRDKEGMSTSADFTFTNTSEGRTITGSYHRETQSYSGVGIDKARFQYSDSNFQADAGSYWARWTDLTLLGAEVNGARIQKEFGPIRLQVISGRTQDPSTSGSFKQNAAGLRLDLDAGRHKFGVMALKTDDKGDVASIPGSLPARAALFSILHEAAVSRNVHSSIEVAKSFRRTLAGSNTKNDAFKLDIEHAAGRFTGQAALYRIDQDYLPVSESSAKYLNSDRAGYRLNTGYKLLDWVKIGAEFEKYNTQSTSLRTRRGAAFVTFTHSAESLTLRKSRLTAAPGTRSDIQAATFSFSLNSIGAFGRTQISLGLMDFSYTSPTLDADIRNLNFSLYGSFRNSLVFSISSNVGDSDEAVSASSVTNRARRAGLTWNALPGKLALTGNYEALTGKGTSTDKREIRTSLGLKFTVNSACALRLDWESVSYSDTLSSAFNYRQNIWRAGTEWGF